MRYATARGEEVAHGVEPATAPVPFDEMPLPDGTPRPTDAAMVETLSGLGVSVEITQL